MKNLHDIAGPLRSYQTFNVWADRIVAGELPEMQPFQRRWVERYWVHPQYEGDPRDVLDIYAAAQEIAMSRRARDRAVLMVTRREMQQIIWNTPAWQAVEGGDRYPRLYGVRLIVGEDRY